jgi:hypothetical protein
MTAAKIRARYKIPEDSPISDHPLTKAEHGPAGREC